MFYHPWIRLGLLAPFLALGACATIVEGDDQTVSVITDPPGARCELTRDGQTVGFVNPTPGSVALGKSSDHVSVRCEKDDHFDGAAVLASSFQGMTFGNIIFGGIIGVAVDAASGSMHQYPADVTVVLAPKAFANAAMRDRFFDRQKERVLSEAAKAAADAKGYCQSAQERQDCDAVIAAIETERDIKLRDLEDQRTRATVN